MYLLAEGRRGSKHIADRFAMTPAGGSHAICGARIISVALDTKAPIGDLQYKATCGDCSRIAWRKGMQEEYAR